MFADLGKNRKAEKERERERTEKFFDPIKKKFKIWKIKIQNFRIWTLKMKIKKFQDLNTALDEALESFDLASTKWLEGNSRPQNTDAVKK
jgi:hypothetical protein